MPDLISSGIELRISPAESTDLMKAIAYAVKNSDLFLFEANLSNLSITRLMKIDRILACAQNSIQKTPGANTDRETN